jgi:hypothetical protein
MMKTISLSRIFLLLLFAVLLGFTSGPLGCSKAREELEETVEPLMVLPERTKVRVDLLTIRKAVEFYQVDHDGKYPSNLKELKLDLHYPDEYTYDPTKGKVKSKNYPGM